MQRIIIICLLVTLAFAQEYKYTKEGYLYKPSYIYNGRYFFNNGEELFDYDPTMEMPDSAGNLIPIISKYFYNIGLGGIKLGLQGGVAVDTIVYPFPEPLLIKHTPAPVKESQQKYKITVTIVKEGSLTEILKMAEKYGNDGVVRIEPVSRDSFLIGGWNRGKMGYVQDTLWYKETLCK